MSKWREAFNQVQEVSPLPKRENGGPSPVGTLVERVGKRMEFFERHKNDWSPEERERRAAQLLADHQALDGALAATGGRIEDHGWTVSPHGAWHRRGQEPYEAPLTEAETLVKQAMERAGDLILAGADPDPHALSRAEQRLNEAFTAGDLPALRRAAVAYVNLYEPSLALAAPSPEDLARRAELLDTAAAHGYPRLRIAPAVSVLPGEEHWTNFCCHAGPDHLQAAAVALAAQPVLDLARAT